MWKAKGSSLSVLPKESIHLIALNAMKVKYPYIFSSDFLIKKLHEHVFLVAKEDQQFHFVDFT